MIKNNVIVSMLIALIGVMILVAFLFIQSEINVVVEIAERYDLSDVEVIYEYEQDQFLVTLFLGETSNRSYYGYLVEKRSWLNRREFLRSGITNENYFSSIYENIDGKDYLILTGKSNSMIQTIKSVFNPSLSHSSQVDELIFERDFSSDDSYFVIIEEVEVDDNIYSYESTYFLDMNGNHVKNSMN